MPVDRMAKELSEQAIEKVVQWMDALTTAKDQLNNIYKEVVSSSNAFCVIDKKRDEVKPIFARVEEAERNFRSALAQTIKEIRNESV